MIDETYIELMHKEIDGIIEPEERDELQKYISDNDEAKNYYRDLMQTTNLLKDIPAVSPPRNLKAQIMESLDWNKYQKKAEKPALDSILSNWFFRPRYKLAYAFAIGIVVGIFIYALFFSTMNTKEALNNSDLYGTIGVNSGQDLKELQNIPINLDLISGSIHLRQFKDFIVFDVNLKSISDFDLRLEYESSDYRFKGFQRDGNNEVFLKQDDNSIEISTFEDARYLVFFYKANEKPSPIDLKILQVGQVLSHQNIYVNIF